MSKILRFIPLLILLLSFNLSAQSPKRGLAYGYHTQEDMNVLKEGISWWYNWSSQPDAGVANYYQSLGVEFVPMFWNNNFNVEEAIENIPEGAKYILAYNEPNFYVEANISPQYAASVWYKIEQVAAARGLQIVSASPAYCGGNACPSEYYDPTKWHDEFFAECPECWVDYIAFHTYEGNPYGAIALTNNLKKYGRPIWVTEFANWDSNQSQEDKIEHMQIMVNAYENDPDIFRYSWFTGRASSNPSINILGSNGTLTPLGTAYLSASYTQKKYNVPGKIEAENHYRRNRTNLENTTDDGAGQNVSHIDAGDWGDYLVQIDQSGSYTFQFRVASLNGGGNLNILLDGELIKSNVEIPLTGGWQNWTTVEVPGVVLTGGEHLIRFYYSAGGFNLNYFTTVYESGLPPNADFTASSVSTCLGNSVIFSDATTNKIGSEVYNWNFGTDATPATASGAGPHSVIYSTPGFKTVSLEVINSNGSNTKTKSNFFVSGTTNGCLFSDGFDNNIVNWITPIPGAFSHSEADGAWKITNNGYGEWENFQYTINNGSE
ncbi:MAG TPA: glycosyl hydrolase, partial [Cytophagaceae bacterium]